ncbi:putative monocarboxylate transporter, partial [Aureobasidium melanogenum]
MNHNNTSIDDVDEEKDRIGDMHASNTSIPTEKESPPGVVVNTEQPPSDVVPAAEPPPAPNGGYGWVCVVCVALINGHTWGLNSSYGVFLSYYLANNVFPGATYLEFAFVGSLSIACALLVSPVATIFTRKFGTRTTLFTGVAFETASLIGASFAKQIWQLFLSQGVCFGFGMGFLFVGSVGIVPQWFTTKRSLANGIATAGSGLGGLIYSLATGAMIPNIGLGWAFRVLGIVACVVNGICAMLVKDRNKAIGSSQLAFDVQLFKRTEYLLLLGFGWFSMLAYVVLLFSLANFARSVGLTASQASIVSAILNLGQAVGRPPIGYFSDSIGRINMATLMTFMSGLFALVIWTNAKSFGVLIFYAIVGGTVAGTFWTTIAPVTAEVVGLRNVPAALNICWLVLVIPCTFSEPIGLEIVSFDGGYLGAQLFTGFMYTGAAICALFLRSWKIAEVDEIESSQDVGDVDAVAIETKVDENRGCLFAQTKLTHNTSILSNLQISSSAHVRLHVTMFSPLAIQTITYRAAQVQAMKRIVISENVSIAPKYKLDKVKAVMTTKKPEDSMLISPKTSVGRDTVEVLIIAGKNGNLHASQKDRILRQQVPAPPPHVLKSRRETYFANVLTASIFCIDDSQHFCNFTVESQEQWIALLESYKDVRYRKFTPAYEEVLGILERLYAVMSGRCSSPRSLKEKRVKQSQNITDKKSSSIAASPQRHPKVNSPKPTPPSADVASPSEPTQAFRYPESMKQLPRLTPQSFRQHIRNQGLEGTFVEFVPFASLAESNPAKRYKEYLEQHGMADYVEWVVPGSGWH